jgi:ABC-type polysaccharide/polyol phosphate transport system ATPase subunit
LNRVGVTSQGLWKKFHRGEIHDSLRDLIPAVARRISGRGPRAADLGAQDFWALRDVSFEVKAGEALGIIGPNGAGKSTILKLLSGILKPTRGRLSIHGRLRALIEIAAGFHPDLTGRENVFLNGAILGMRGSEVARKLDRIIDFSGIEPFIDTPVKRYSSGMLARLGFSVAAHMEPEVLVVDEILSVGDLAFQRKCYAHMSGLASQGVAVVFVSHNLGAVSQLCPQTMVLGDGTVRFIGPTADAERCYLSLLSARRRESSDIVLEEFELTDEAGRPKTVFATGEVCRIRAVVGSRRHYPKFALGLSLAAPSGDEVFHTTCHRLDGSSVSLIPDGRVLLDARLVLNLVGGDYTVFLQCHDYSELSSEICRFDAGRLQVPPRPEFGGVSFLEPRLEMRTVESGDARLVSRRSGNDE